MNHRLAKITIFPILLLCLIVMKSTVVFAQRETVPDLLNVRLNPTYSTTNPSPIVNSTTSSAQFDNLPFFEVPVVIDDATESAGQSEPQTLTIDQERVQIRQKYRVAAETYQQSYREYSLAKAQFQKLGTLASLEEAVLDTRKALLDRNRLLMIFFELIHLELRASVGVDPERKQAALTRIENFQSELKAQEQLIQNSQDRVALVARVQWFLETAEKLRSHGFYIRALILSGRLFVGYQHALLLYEETKAYHQSQEVDSYMTAERLRAYNEVDAQINLVNAQWSKIQEVLFAEGNRDQNWFQRILPLLSAQQTNLIRLFAFIEELARK